MIDKNYSAPPFSTPSLIKGFTVIELLISITIIAVLTTIALPNFSDFLVRTRVDNEISEMQRLLLATRNTAINAEKSVTICPLNVSNSCQNSWKDQISVFEDIDGDGIYEPGNGDRLIKVKSAIQAGDKLQFTQASLTYTATGRLSGVAAASTFNYCPKDHTDKSRGITVSASGRSYVSSGTDNDGIDEDRSGNEITCI
jgi:prepilin-type N-terminal cleavage/methylation domain-containing protein